MKEMKMGMRRIGVRFLKEWREWKEQGVFYKDDLVLCGELDEDLNMKMRRSVRNAKGI